MIWLAQKRTLRFAGACVVATAVSGCADISQSDASPYLGIETQKLDISLVKLVARMSGPEGETEVEEYARCAAAQYALIRGFGFARHIRTNRIETSGIWQADAVYTISAALPPGERTLDAEPVVADCAEKGIPTV